MPASRDDVLMWLGGIADGSIDLTVDNPAMAQAVLAILNPLPEPEPLPEGYLSPHFTLAEMTASSTATSMGIPNQPNQSAYDQLVLLANDTLEEIRTICGGNPVMISSGYRGPQLNAAIGGATNSAHLYGAAADLNIPAYGSAREVCHAIEPHLKRLKIDQLIYESSGSSFWVHVGRAIPPSTTPRHQVFTIANGQTIQGIA